VVAVAAAVDAADPWCLDQASLADPGVRDRRGFRW
jgi:hypothetical protein